MFSNRQCDKPAASPPATVARLTVGDVAAGERPVLNKMLDDVGPNPMPRAPSTIAAKNPASPTTNHSGIH
jgi:hypothetical protein